MMNRYQLYTYLKQAVFFLILFSALSSAAQQKLLKGTYTVGGAGADYPTIKKAAIELSNAKVTGPVIFNIRPGLYTDVVKFLPFSGATATNKVIFRSETGKAEDVVIQTSGGGYAFNHHAVQLNAVKYLTLRNLTIINTSATYGSGIHLTNNAINNMIDSCTIRMDSLSGSNSLGGIVSSAITNMYGPGTNASANTISNTTISGGYYGIRLLGDANLHDMSFRLINNHITGSAYAGIYVLYQDELVIEKNFIKLSAQLDDTRYGIAIHSCGGKLMIEANKVINPGTFGLIMTRVLAAEESMIANNMFGGGFRQANPAYGIYLDSVFNVNFYFNSIHHDAALQEDNAAFYSLQSQKIKLVNNILSASKGAYTLYVQGNATFTDCDYNDYHTTGPAIGWFNASLANLDSLQAATLDDEHSITIPPQFTSTSDLHIHNPLLFDKGIYVASVGSDIEGEPRDDEMPEPGADELFHSETDFRITAIIPFIPVIGSNTFSIKLKNAGLRSLNDSTVTLSFSTDGGTSWSAPETFTPTQLGKTNDQQVYTFTNPWVVSTRGTYSLCVRINPPAIASDTFPANNSYCTDICIGLKGIYTIGGSNPDFPSIAAAVSNLSCGIGGNVLFNIHSGTYNERISISSILQTDAKHSVTFRSETDNAADVIITHDGGNSVSNHHVIQLRGAHNIHFRNLTVINTGSNYGSGFHLAEGCDSIVIAHCVIRVSTDITTPNTFMPVIASAVSGIQSQGKNLSNSRIEDNYLFGGDAGIMLIGPGGNARDANNRIDRNMIDSVFTTGIYTLYNDLLSVDENTVNLRRFGSNLRTGLRILQCRNNLSITKNKIREAGKYGMYLSDMEGISQVDISNNMVGGGFTVSSGHGIYGSALEKVNFYYNTIYYDGTQSASAAFYLNSGLSIKMLNNIFCNKGGGLAYKIPDPESILRSDYNDLFTTGSVLASWNNVNRADLPALRTASGGYETNSVSADPQVISYADLHLAGKNLEGKALVLPEVADDIDGVKRHPFTPDIGADEAIFTPVDMAVVNISPVVLLMGNNTIRVQLRNEGISSLTDSSVSLSYSTDSGQTWTVPEQFIPDSLSATYDTEIFSFSTPLNVTKKSSFTICVRINAPGLVSDTNSVNNYYCMDICTGLPAGVYTVGGANPDYGTIGQAVSDLACGIAGAVTFMIRPGTYNERLIIPRITNASALNTVRFTSQTGAAEDVVISSAGGGAYNDHHTVQLRGSAFVVLDRLTIVNTATDNATGIHLTQNATFDTIRNCIVKMDSVSHDMDIIAIVSSDTTGIYDFNSNASYNVIEGNTISGGYIGISLGGAAPAIPDAGNEIKGNTFTDVYRYAISSRYVDLSAITDNRIYMYPGQENAMPIAVYYAKGDLTIADNYISNTGNTGIYLDKVSSPHATVISNNMIAGGFMTGGSGITLVNSNNINVYYNSVNFDGSSSLGSAFRVTGNCKRVTVLNNNFAAKTGYAYYILTPGAIVASDHNNLYTKGSKLVYWSPNQFSNLSDYRNFSTKDSNSVSADPKYTSASDLHILNPALNGKARPLSFITTDFDGESRSLLKPDIGADEFIVVEDLGVIAFVSPVNGSTLETPEPVSVQIRNQGNVDMINFEVAYSIDGDEPVRETVKTVLGPGQTMVYDFDSIFTPLFSAPYSLCAFTSVVEDFDISDDTTCISVISTVADTVDGGVSEFISPVDNTVLSGAAAVKVKVNNYGNMVFRNYMVRLSIDGTVVHTKSVSDSLQPDSSAVIDLGYSLNPAAGYHEIRAYTIIANEDFAVNDTAMIGITVPVGIENTIIESEQLYPNPAKGTAWLDLKSAQGGEFRLVLSDLPGKVILDQFYVLKAGEDQRITLDLENLAPGTYLLSMYHHGERRIRKLVVGE